MIFVKFVNYLFVSWKLNLNRNKMLHEVVVKWFMAGRNKKKESLLSSNIIWKAAIYTRRSFDDMDETESDTISNQKDLVASFLSLDNNIQIVDFYTDDGYSGTSFNRPGFKKMLNDIINGNINLIAVKDLSRLGRNYIEVGKYIENIFPLYNVRIISINDNIDSYKDPSSINSIVVPIKNLINDEYAKDISKKVRTAYQTMARSGKFASGTTPYGYMLDPDDKHKLIINPEEEKNVLLIFNMAKEGAGRIKICKYLNSNFILCRKELQRRKKRNIDCDDRTIERKYKWTTTTIGRMLENEVYIGNLVQNKTSSISYKNHKLVSNPKDKWIKVENTHPAIITKEFFDEVQKGIGERRGKKGKTRKYSIYSGILKCGDCKRAMTKQSDTRGNRKAENFYCSSFLRTDTDCSSHKISSSSLNSIVLKTINLQVDLVLELDKKMKKIQTYESKKELSCEYSYSKNKCLRDLEKFKSQKRDAYIEWKLDKINKDKYTILTEKYNAQILRINDELQRINQNYQINLKKLDQQDYWVEHFSKYKKIKKVKRNILVELIDSIYVYENGSIHIKFKYEDEYEEALKFLEECKEDEND